MADLDIAIIARSNRVSFGAISIVAAAVQRQLDAEFLNVWKKHGSIQAFPMSQPPPASFALIEIVDSLADPRLGGFHTTKGGKPFAQVEFSLDNEWSIDVSHEAMEMILDPKGQAFMRGKSPVPGQGDVDFLLEVCDPCGRSSYLKDSVKVADFHLQNYFDAAAVPGTFYSHNRKLVRPRDLLSGGYLTWRDANGQFWQQNRFSGSPPPQAINPPFFGASIRETIDIYTAEARACWCARSKKRRVQKAKAVLSEAETKRRLKRLEVMDAEVERLKRKLGISGKKAVRK